MSIINVSVGGGMIFYHLHKYITQKTQTFSAAKSCYSKAINRTHVIASDILIDKFMQLIYKHDSLYPITSTTNVVHLVHYYTLQGSTSSPHAQSNPRTHMESHPCYLSHFRTPWTHCSLKKLKREKEMGHTALMFA